MSTPCAMLGDWVPIALSTEQVSAPMPNAASVYPMERSVPRTSLGRSTYVSVVISPPTMAMPVVTNVSHATRALGSTATISSSTASLIWSAILSGCPSVTDSEVNSQRRSVLTAHS
ncbi:MAG: hypothetical protein A2085_07000 [Gemmatimonadetes bacterium GWC2_71_10]|nr:MAG: hypothetical protein A2085_07000 [Gemmatimonadetes bacterium GWC2_71_10]